MKSLPIILAALAISAGGASSHYEKCRITHNWDKPATCSNIPIVKHGAIKGVTGSSPNDPGDPRSPKEHDNKGFGNGDEGDCHGGGCNDSDNPGNGHDHGKGKH